MYIYFIASRPTLIENHDDSLLKMYFEIKSVGGQFCFILLEKNIANCLILPFKEIPRN